MSFEIPTPGEIAQRRDQERQRKRNNAYARAEEAVAQLVYGSGDGVRVHLDDDSVEFKEEIEAAYRVAGWHVEPTRHYADIIIQFPKREEA